MYPILRFAICFATAAAAVFIAPFVSATYPVSLELVAAITTLLSIAAMLYSVEPLWDELIDLFRVPTFRRHLSRRSHSLNRLERKAARRLKRPRTWSEKCGLALITEGTTTTTDPKTGRVVTKKWKRVQHPKFKAYEMDAYGPAAIIATAPGKTYATWKQNMADVEQHLGLNVRIDYIDPRRVRLVALTRDPLAIPAANSSSIPVDLATSWDDGDRWKFPGGTE